MRAAGEGGEGASRCFVAFGSIHAGFWRRMSPEAQGDCGGHLSRGHWSWAPVRPPLPPTLTQASSISRVRVSMRPLRWVFDVLSLFPGAF